MVNIFGWVGTSVKWIGKELGLVSTWLPKVVKIADDVNEEAPVLLPQVIILVEDVDSFALAMVKDGGATLTSFGALGVAVVAAAGDKMVNIAEDVRVIAAFQALIKEVSASDTWKDVIATGGKLVTDYEAFGSAAKSAIAKLEADVK